MCVIRAGLFRRPKWFNCFKCVMMVRMNIPTSAEQVSEQVHAETEAETEQPKWVPVLIATTAVLLAGLIIAPLSLSGQDIVAWARKGLGLDGLWPLVVFYSLDATAFICVLVCVYCAYMGTRAGMFFLTVWVIAVLSAYAQYGHNIRDKEHAPDGWWFFPAMALLAPFMLELVLAKVRAIQRQRRGEAAKPRPKFPLWRWIPGVGSFVETYGAWRVSLLLNLATYEDCVNEYRRLCPEGGLGVLKAIRLWQQAARNAEARAEQNMPDEEEHEERDMRGGEEQDRAPDITPEPEPTEEAEAPEPNTPEPEPKAEQGDDQKAGPEKPKKEPKKNSRSDKKLVNAEYLKIMRREWPDELPSGYQVRTKLGVNYPKSVKLLEAREQELKK